jgi:hypothetical protein
MEKVRNWVDNELIKIFESNLIGEKVGICFIFIQGV